MKQEAKRSYRIGGRPSTARGAGRPTPSSLSLAALLGIAGAAMGCSGAEPGERTGRRRGRDHRRDRGARRRGAGGAQGASGVRHPPAQPRLEQGERDAFVGQEKPNNNYGALVVALTSGAGLTAARALQVGPLGIPSDATVSSGDLHAHAGEHRRGERAGSTWSTRPGTKATVTWSSFGAGYDAADARQRSATPRPTMSFNLVAHRAERGSAGRAQPRAPGRAGRGEHDQVHTAASGRSRPRGPSFRVCYQVTCDATHADCDGDGTNGCETDLELAAELRRLRRGVRRLPQRGREAATPASAGSAPATKASTTATAIPPTAARPTSASMATAGPAA
jgi:hypothetical protein